MPANYENAYYDEGSCPLSEKATTRPPRKGAAAC